MLKGDVIECVVNPRGSIKSTARYIGEPAEIVAIINDGAALVLFPDGHQMTLEFDQIRSLKDKPMTMKREVGDRIIVNDGRDYAAIAGRVVPSTFKDAKEDEKCIYLSQGKGGISVSLETLERILKWGRGDN